MTIQIGANDGFVCQKTTADHCLSASELNRLIAQIEDNLRTIYQAIRNVAHYHGRIVAVTYYSIDYTNPLDNLQSGLINSAVIPVTKQFGGIIAMQPTTGEILAVAGIGLNDLQPPGSTFKMVTLTSVLEAGLARPESTFPYRSSTTLDGVRLENANGESCGGSLALA